MAAASTVGSQLSPAAEEAHRRGVVAAIGGDFERALEAFKHAVFLQPDFAEGYRCIGLTLMELAREDEALGAFQEAIRLAPDFALAYMHMAQVLSALGRNAEGLRAYREGVRLEPQLVRAFQGLDQYLLHSSRRQISDPPQRFYLTHFSVLPPAGGNWLIHGQTKDDVTFGRINVGRGRLHTIVASAALMPVPEELQSLDRLREHVERRWRSEARGPRYTPLEVKVTNARLGDSECVRLDGRSEDRGAMTAEGRVLILEVHEFYCPSPITSMVVVALAYSQRFLEGAQPLPIENEVTPFLNSMKFRL